MVDTDEKAPQDSNGLDEDCKHDFEVVDRFSGHRNKGGYKVPVSVMLKECTKCGGQVAE